MAVKTIKIDLQHIPWDKIYQDDKSKKVWDTWQKRDDDTFIEGDYNEQYFPIDLPRPREPLNFIDGGAYIGDTLDQIMRLGFKVETAVAFEPIPHYFGHLIHNIRRMRKLHPEWSYIPMKYALSNKIETLKFVDTGIGTGGVVANGALFDEVVWNAKQERGKVDVETTTIDHAIAILMEKGMKFEPNYIKLDIEGMEPQALEGSLNTIFKYRPRMAVCVYHLDWQLVATEKIFKNNEIIRVPALLNALDLDYRFFLRQNFDAHGMVWEETILYVIPKEDL